MRIHRRLTEDSHEWANARPEAKEDFLYTGARLEVSRDWFKNHSDELNTAEPARCREREGRVGRTGERAWTARSAEATATYQKQLSRRFLIAGVVAVVFAAASAVFGLWAVSEWKIVAHQRDEVAHQRDEIAKVDDCEFLSTSRSFASEPRRQIDRSILLAVEAVNKANTACVTRCFSTMLFKLDRC